MNERYIGIDLGTECIKVVEIIKENEALTQGRTWLRDHGKDPRHSLSQLLDEIGWQEITGAAVTGALSGSVNLFCVPMKAAVAEGLALNFTDSGPWTVVSIGCHGFAVIEVLEGGRRRIRENSRCSQGTGNFLRQLVERFALTLPEADALCEGVKEAAPLSGRCPVILKTDMTHLANHGTDHSRVLAGLYDAVCENVQALLKPAPTPTRMLLIGGVANSARIQHNFCQLAPRLGMTFVEGEPARDRFLEAWGAAVIAARQQHRAPLASELFTVGQKTTFERVPPLREALSLVNRMTAPPVVFKAKPVNGTPIKPQGVILGLDIGSTGSKALALDPHTRQPLWQAYAGTLGNPVAAAQGLMARFVDETKGQLEVLGIGATGSGREIVGSLMASSYGRERIYVLNEIAAHAEGASYYAPEVDTIFEIGGQDAKFIRLDGGRICDAAMNEACSAGTGSFIEEQGSKFEGITHPSEMSKLALAADYGISLGQHCSVFMAEIIDQAVAAAEPAPAILAGVYDAVVQNYLNRVKGTRSVGNLIFCQGMPFQSDALAAAVARRTGRQVVVPPNPGTIGALGIALLAARDLNLATATPLDMTDFLTARIEAKDTFACASKQGCGGAGNHCRIDRLTTLVAGKKQRFLWGGSCSLYDAGTGKRKLPVGAPDPFRQRAALIHNLREHLTISSSRPTVALTDEFTLKGMLPFFATFIRRLGFAVRFYQDGDQHDLKRGIESANVPYCAPMQLYHGMVDRMLADEPDFLLAPMLRDLAHSQGQLHSVTCPVVQASPGLITQAFFRNPSSTRLLAPLIEIGMQNLASTELRRSCMSLAKELGVGNKWEEAYQKAVTAQNSFENACREIGKNALAYAQLNKIPAIVVLGRSYTIHNNVLNSNVPNLLREQGALAIPVDCYPVEDEVPVFDNIYWHYSQTNLRAAHQIRRSDDVYSIFCSNYSCGPDSFNLQFFNYIMENKPFAIIETDGHSGDAGTKTRIEAFLHCVESDRKARTTQPPRCSNNLSSLDRDSYSLDDVKRNGDILLIPPMGVSAGVLAGALRGEGLKAEVLPLPDREALTMGRRYTSGKECIPLAITLGSTLQRLEREPSSTQTFTLFMPTASGPCRFGSYHLFDQIALTKTSWKDRVRLVSPSDADYFAGTAPDLQPRVLFGMVAADLLLAALHDVRPVETTPGAAREIFDRYYQALIDHVEHTPGGNLWQTLAEVPRGMLGVRELLARAAREFAAVKNFSRDLPLVSVVGEIYVRLDPFANDSIVERLEQAGVRARLAPFHEWLEYTTWTCTERISQGRPLPGDNVVNAYLTSALQEEIIDRLYLEMARPLAWPKRTTVKDSLAAGANYVTPQLLGEAILTVGSALHEYQEGEIDGVVSVGPLECMPNKIAESHFQRIDGDHGLPSLTLQLNGDPVDPRLIDAFVFEVKERRTQERRIRHSRPRSWAHIGWKTTRGILSAALHLIPPAAIMPRQVKVPVSSMELTVPPEEKWTKPIVENRS